MDTNYKIFIRGLRLPRRMNDINYVEVKVTCTDCGKELKIVTLEGTDTSDYLCPRCSAGELAIDIEE